MRPAERREDEDAEYVARRGAHLDDGHPLPPLTAPAEVPALRAEALRWLTVAAELGDEQDRGSLALHALHLREAEETDDPAGARSDR